VPTIQQAVLKQAEQTPELAKALQLRLIRSSSASLPPSVFNRMTELFDCPVLEAYAMTETASQITCNTLDKQYAGWVGKITQPEVKIIDGEICVKGKSVMPGYLNNDEANSTAFINGWFRTGDLGIINDNGILKIVGRTKEIIVRGAEKISPLEVDNCLMNHPSIDQVVTFAVKHKTLGEDVAAAIVLKPGAEITEQEIKTWARQQLSSFKVPKQIILVDSIPKGSTGKVQRIGLAEKLGLE
jgi:acyl-CoA synthetase (AMP-forming)/AMP-acid ligase II